MGAWTISEIDQIMKYIKPILQKNNKTASDFINWICDERKNHELKEHSGKDLIVIDSNCGSGGHIYIDECLSDKLDEFINKPIAD